MYFFKWQSVRPFSLGLHGLQPFSSRILIRLILKSALLPNPRLFCRRCAVVNSVRVYYGRLDVVFERRRRSQRVVGLVCGVLASHTRAREPFSLKHGMGPCSNDQYLIGGPLLDPKTIELTRLAIAIKDALFNRIKEFRRIRSTSS
jgi:hypothetical protein